MDYHIVSHSTQVYKWVPKDLILGGGGRDPPNGLPGSNADFTFVPL